MNWMFHSFVCLCLFSSSFSFLNLKWVTKVILFNCFWNFHDVDFRLFPIILSFCSIKETWTLACGMARNVFYYGTFCVVLGMRNVTLWDKKSWQFFKPEYNKHVYNVCHVFCLNVRNVYFHFLLDQSEVYSTNYFYSCFHRKKYLSCDSTFISYWCLQSHYLQLIFFFFV